MPDDPFVSGVWGTWEIEWLGVGMACKGSFNPYLIRIIHRNPRDVDLDATTSFGTEGQTCDLSIRQV